MSYIKMQDLTLANKRVLIRQDLNVPIENGVITNDARIRASLATIKAVLKQGGRLMLMSHLGRPTEGEYQAEFSLQVVADYLAQQLGQPVKLKKDWLECDDLAPAAGEVVLCENVRFNLGEKRNDSALAKKMARHCDIFVMDAFGTAHRAQASTYGVAEFAPIACAGPLLSSELDALSKALSAPAKPVVAIVGGSKVSTKLTVLDNLVGKVEQLIVGGGIANTFIESSGYRIGQSLTESDFVEQAQQLIAQAQGVGADIPIPSDVVCATEFNHNAQAVKRAVNDVKENELILDIGEQTAQRYAKLLAEAGTIVWNGPVGVFEFEQFGAGTKAIAKAVAASSAFSIAGGGDTVAAIEKYGVAEQISYISTGGGAFLEFLEGKQLPAVAILEQRANN